MPVRIKVDENLPVEVADRLRSAGHDVRTVTEQGLTGTPDDALWDAAATRRIRDAGRIRNGGERILEV